MSEIKSTGSATWKGTLKEGTGVASTRSGSISDTPITFASRFEGKPGLTPEELIAAAHAACFSMALSGKLTQAGTPPTSIHTEATVTLRRDESGSNITKVHLSTRAQIPGADAAALNVAATAAKDGCPVSRLLKPGLEEISFDATLEG
jgi:osmotically inducible protein OsmC